MTIAITLALATFGGDTAAARTAPAPRAGWRQITKDGCYKQRPVWSKDGARIMFSRLRGDHIALVTVDRYGGDEKRLTKHEPPECDAVWSPTADLIAFTRITFSGTQGDMDIMLIKPDGGDLKPFAKTENGKLSFEEWPSWTADGKRIAFSSTKPENQEIFAANLDGSGLVRITQSPGTDSHPSWSPDAKTIAFATERWGGIEIAAANADGSNVRRLTKSPGLDDYPCWSPDGKSLVFVSNRDKNYEVYRMRADGGGQVNLTRSPGTDAFPSWRPDGRAILFVSEQEGKYDLFEMELAKEPSA